jgi:Na+-transporting NADH:ubiquinone oxidoreductase subunit C
MHGVDGISGGTITSDGVSDMLDERLSKYLPFFNQKLSEMIEADTVVVDSLQALTLNTIK